ncbi:hypothetical protein HMPREF0791_0199, partial [Staphylococcus epidermidis W23144]
MIFRKRAAGLAARLGDRVEQQREQLWRHGLAPAALEPQRIPARLGEHQPAVALLGRQAAEEAGIGDAH